MTPELQTVFIGTISAVLGGLVAFFLARLQLSTTRDNNKTEIEHLRDQTRAQIEVSKSAQETEWQKFLLRQSEAALIEADKAHARADALNTELRTATTERSVLQNEVGGLRTETANMRAALEASDKNNAALMTAVTGKDAEIGGMKKAVGDFQAQLEASEQTHAKQVGELSAQIEDLKTEHTQQIADLKAEHGKQVDELKQQIVELQKQLKDLNAIIEQQTGKSTAATEKQTVAIEALTKQGETS